MTGFTGILRRAIALGVMGSMIVSMTGCYNTHKGGSEGGTGGTNETVSIDDSTPWYDTSTVDITAETLGVTDKCQYQYIELVGHDDSYVCLRIVGLKSGYDENVSSDDYYDYAIDRVCLVSLSDDSVASNIDLSSYSAENSGINSLSYADSKLELNLFTYDPDTYEGKTQIVTLDMSTGEELDRTDDAAADSDQSSSPERVFNLNGYTVNTYFIYSDSGDSSYQIGIIPEGGNEKKVDVKPEDGSALFDISSIFELSDDSALIVGSSSGDSTSTTMYFTINLATGEIVQQNAEDYSWLEDANSYHRTYTDSEGVNYVLTNSGMSQIDFTAKTVETTFDYSWTNVNMSRIVNMDIIECNADKLVYGGTLNGSIYSDAAQPFELVTFTKADTNPNVGKTAISLYAGDYVPDYIGQAVCDFNETSPDCRIIYDNNYSIEDYYDEDQANSLNSDDDYSKLEKQANAGLSDKLAVDMMNGEGPDILFNTGSFSQINNSDYLLDLSSYESQFTSDEYFTNIIDSAKVGDSLFQMPVSYTLSGILTNSKNVPDDAKGFTFDEYKQFVDSVCNGTDPITSGQAVYFTTCFSGMYEKFIVDGQANFNNDDFAALANYVKDNVPETGVSWNSDDTDSVADDTPAATRTDLSGIGSYFSSYTSGNKLMGLPSTDGRGSYITPVSVAISSSAADPDACWSFVQTLLSEDTQTRMATGESGLNPVNRAAFDTSAAQALSYYQTSSSADYYVDSAGKKINYTQDMVDYYKSLVESADYMLTDDSAIDLILMEEMPAFFSGQKTLDEVTDILQDRVQTVIDERG